MYRLVVCLILLAMLVPATASAGQSQSSQSSADPQHRPTVTRNLTSMPLAFTENRGQWDDQVKFRAVAGGATMWFTETGTYYQFARIIPGEEVEASTDPDYGQDDPPPLESKMIKASFVGANPNPNVAGVEPMVYKCNYFIGNAPNEWYTDVPNFQAIALEEVYEGIDLKYYGNGRQMEYDFIVSPGADPSEILVAYEGVKSISVNPSGQLVVETDWGEVVEQKPLVYQVVDGSRRLVPCEYVITGDNVFGFHLPASYNTELALVIDPVISYSTYLGGAADDYTREIAVDTYGCAYVTGHTYSSDFPLENPYQSHQAVYTGFVTKLSSTGSSLVYSTYLGGSGHDWCRSIAVDVSGNVYVVGKTASSNFPTQNPCQTMQGGSDGFVTKLNGAGNGLIYSTYLGGSGSDNCSCISLDGLGGVYVTGNTESRDFPTENPYQASYGGGIYDAFVAKMSSSGCGLIYSTYLGGENLDHGTGISTDDLGCAYVAGSTVSADFPTENPYQADYGGGDYDAFVTKLSSSGASLIYSTYLGGSDSDEGSRIVVDGSGDAYLTGFTYSANFPIEAPYLTDQGDVDAFVTRFSSSGSNLVYSTYLGGDDRDFGYGISLGASGEAIIVGETWSDNFPTVNPVQPDFGGGIWDGFVTKLANSGDTPTFSTYLGGSDEDKVFEAAEDASGNLYVTGYTSSDDFPTLNPVMSDPNDDNHDAYVTKYVFVCNDADGDGYGDPGFPDDDCDPDNCPEVHNPGQEDTNDNEVGDICESGYTPRGSDIAVPIDFDIIVTFDNVTEPGVTTVSTSLVGEPPSGYLFIPLGTPTYYNIETIAVYTGNVTVCMTYDDADVGLWEPWLRLFHWDPVLEPEPWEDITASHDLIGNVICGVSTSLSPFAMARDESCCVDRVGDANGLGGDEPTIGDISTMIDVLFISANPELIACYAEADINQSGGSDPQPDDITIGDISTLIDYLFITGPELGLPDCL